MQATKAHSYKEPALLLERLWPQVREVLEAYAVPQSEVERLVQDTLLALLYKWESIGNHEYWLLKTLEHRCRRIYGEASNGGASAGV